jgi:glycerol-3-phosphate acyltransferase PlsY
MKFVALIVGSYLLGSVPFGFIIAKTHGIDLRKIGSGNIGATNLARALGRKWALLCFALDVAKGLFPTLAAASLFSSLPTVPQLLFALAGGCAAILGHIFSIYLKFKGGKGIATGFGVALGLYPYYTVCAAIALAVWIIIVLIWRYVSLASIVASFSFPIVLICAIAVNNDWKLVNLWPLLVAATVIPVMVIFRHRENIKRLLAGTESKVLQKTKMDVRAVENSRT